MAMKDMIMPQSSSSSKPGSSSSSPNSMHKNSHVISKLKPKIRIIHIFAPEIIKTDVANFRELVQKLTGKPQERKLASSNSSSSKKNPSSSLEYSTTAFINDMQLRDDEWVINGEKMIKEEENESWDNVADNSCRGFLDGFADLDGFIQELSNSSSYMPMKSSHPHMGCV